MGRWLCLLACGCPEEPTAGTCPTHDDVLADLQAQISAQEARIAALEAATTVAPPMESSYCGSTAAAGAALGGYPAVKAMCEATCGTATAHMCDGNELRRSAQLGQITTESGWYGADYAPYGSTGRQDCQGWRSSSETESGPVWVGTEVAPFPSTDFCDTTWPFLCCDLPPSP